jgi:hypothetical protein
VLTHRLAGGAVGELTGWERWAVDGPRRRSIRPAGRGDWWTARSLRRSLGSRTSRVEPGPTLLPTSRAGRRPCLATLRRNLRPASVSRWPDLPGRRRGRPAASSRTALERPDRRVAEPPPVGDSALTRRRFGGLRRMGWTLRPLDLGHGGLGRALLVLGGDVRRAGGRGFLGGPVAGSRWGRDGTLLGRGLAALAGGDRLGAEPRPERGSQAQLRCGVAPSRRRRWVAPGRHRRAILGGALLGRWLRRRLALLGGALLGRFVRRRPGPRLTLDRRLRVRVKRGIGGRA